MGIGETGYYEEVSKLGDLIKDASVDGPFVDKETLQADLTVTFKSKEDALMFAAQHLKVKYSLA